MDLFSRILYLILLFRNVEQKSQTLGLADFFIRSGFSSVFWFVLNLYLNSMKKFTKNIK
jgi:hypothetical protein